LVDISNKLPVHFVALFRPLLEAAQARNTPLFVVGATARDMILRYAHGLESPCTTIDIDVAIQVSEWDQFDRFVKALVDTGEFRSTNLGYRFVCANGETLDVLPFGPIAGAKSTVAFPKALDFVLSVVGLEEAFNASIKVILSRSPHLELQSCSPAGLAMLKLISWDHGFPGRAKDAEDFCFVAEHYIDAGNDIRLHTDASDLMQGVPIKLELAGAQLLGRDIARIAGTTLRDRAITILARETDPEGPLALISDALRRRVSWEEQFDETLVLLRGVLEGLMDKVSPR
jgi:predicted nucleotidyltransferase